ncbi:MAG: glutaminyl-peptide cyclotransferase, partial [Calditrichales bacterium]
MRPIFIYLFILFSLAAAQNSSKANVPIPVYTYFIINKIPHDYQAFTQGLVFDGGFLYESTGRHKQSSLRRVDPSNGAIVTLHSLADEYFGEGITIFEDRIYQLTWQSYTGFVYDKSTFLVMEEFFYNTEGWGITHDSTWLLVSDGSATISFLDPHTFEVKHKIEVTANGTPVTMLNELEFVNGEIFANILSSNRIARIDPT